MKKILLLVAAVSAIIITDISAQSIVAAPVPPAVPVSQPCSCPKAFQGFHLGGNVGYGIGVGKTTHNVVATGFSRANKSGSHGFDGGLNVGYTHRFDNFGLGIEGVFNWSNVKEQSSLFFNAGTTIFYKTRLNNSLQVRANLSYIICNLVAPKIILGWHTSQWTRTISAFDQTGNFGFDRHKKRYNGFLWGAGVDFLIAKHVIAGIEYTHLSASKNSFSKVDSEGILSTFSFTPQHNKFALVLKFIY